MSLPTKAEIRQQIQEARKALPARKERSAAIWSQLTASEAYQTAAYRLFYVSARSEVETHQAVAIALTEPKQVAVPFCAGEVLQLFRLASWDDLTRGAFNILEPQLELRTPERIVQPCEIDLAFIPGVAFDRRGNRLGYGRGYYDRLLKELPAGTMRVGLAFDCQVVDVLPAEEHDERVDWIVTETGILRVARQG